VFFFFSFLCSRKSVKKYLDMARASQLNSLDSMSEPGLVWQLGCFTVSRRLGWIPWMHGQDRSILMDRSQYLGDTLWFIIAILGTLW
jgi:hypothetical protein